MLKVNQLVGFGAGAAAGGPELSYLGRDEDLANGTATHTYSSQPLGVATSDREIIVVVFQENADNARHVSSVTIAGQAGTEHVDEDALNAVGVAIYSATVTSGTTGTITVVFNGVVEDSGIAIYRMVDHGSTTPHDTGQASGSGSTGSANINIPSNGVAIIGTITNFASINSLNGVDTEDFNTTLDILPHASGHQTGMSQETSRTMSATYASSTNYAIVSASWS